MKKNYAFKAKAENKLMRNYSYKQAFSFLSFIQKYIKILQS